MPITETDIDEFVADHPKWPEAAIRAYVDNMGEHYVDPDTLEDDFQESYQGEFDSEVDFAQQLAEDTGSLPPDAYSTWPTSCIDWEHAWRELTEGDYWSTGRRGSVYIFRSI